MQSPPLFTYVINTVRFIYHVNFIELISFVDVYKRQALEQELKQYQAADEAAAQLSQKIDEKTAQKTELTGLRAEYGRALQVASEDSRKPVSYTHLQDNNNVI